MNWYMEQKKIHYGTSRSGIKIDGTICKMQNKVFPQGFRVTENKRRVTCLKCREVLERELGRGTDEDAVEG